MLIGYVSDEKFVAIPDAQVELVDQNGNSWELRARASGAIRGKVPSGIYDVVLARPGFGSKRVSQLALPAQQPYHFRLLADSLYGYAWPKWVRSGEAAEFRVHAVEQY